ncbi:MULTISPECIES: branched-chain amino acid aminotransferase [Actinoalloteichus]|uniref:branched-chain-amino-acid transaminase n=1 Tax=Actinoalloteichus fjordicus TaxID=1612552 RepID=A0AAC9LG79_9PSEU|nr:MULTISPECIES: branched-chain amino acid aminotransferase [Actinoalloteichus]APU17022.1 branched-chain amino acid aminotransferase, group II [Actinoalloteichus fjordicus]APU23102.1 branched-chain amino acid aminotransferase, group II [Actinoalloteichus sp. GBA129-24]
MTSVLPFSRTLNPSPATPERIAEVLANPGFGRHFTDHMVRIDWTADRGWHQAGVLPYAPFEIDPAAMVLHYGQSIFEGLKAYRQADGTVATFRPEDNAARFRSSARRLAMPELPDELFLGSLHELVEVDRHWVPEHAEESLYLRPFMFSIEIGLGVRPAAEYAYLLIASPAGAYFAGGLNPVTVWLSTEFVRASPGGTGAAKFAGNYAASLLAQAQAAEQGCDQVVWLDAVERRWVEEMGGMNLCFVWGSGADATIVTPELTGTLLAGVTRDSLLRLSRDLGYRTEERRVSVEEWESGVASGEITEVFACGTAAVITPVGGARYEGGSFVIGDGKTGAVTQRLRDALIAIQRGTAPDAHGWMHSFG